MTALFAEAGFGTIVKAAFGTLHRKPPDLGIWHTNGLGFRDVSDNGDCFMT
jgi:hypothetical protein